MTPLHYAIENNHNEIAISLIQNGTIKKNEYI